MDKVVEGVLSRSFSRLDRREAAPLRRQTVGDVLTVVALLAAGGQLLIWRAGMLPETGVAGGLLFAVEAVTIGWMILTAVLVTGRSAPNRVAPTPDPLTSLDVFIPVAGEPVEMVRATILAAQAIDWPANVVVCNDGLLAGKDNWRDIELLCQELGVYCITRDTGPRGKAGNLNHALAFSRADAILTIDADHQVVPEVGRELLGWLRHDEVAFVSTPQAFVGSSTDPLNPTEPVFYKAIQPARDRHGLAFSTGNGVVYRREAIVRIGGFSEWSIVEDLHTSIRLHDGGWKSVFHPRPVSIGIAPKTSAEYARQRLRWASDSLRILRYDPPWRRSGLSLRAKVFYSHTLLSYLVAIVTLGFLMGPPAWIVGRVGLLADVGIVEQAVHFGLWLLALCFAFVRWAGVRGTLRSFRLSTALLPMVFIGALGAMFTHAPRRGTVTAKARQPRFNRLVLAGLVLPLGLLGTLVWGALDTRPGGSEPAMFWAALLAILAIGPVSKVGNRRLGPAMLQAAVVISAITLFAGSVATARLGWQAPVDGLYASFEPDPAMADAVIETNDLGATVVTGPAVPAPPDEDRLERPSDSIEVAAGPIALAPTDGIYVGFTSDELPYDLDVVDVWADEVSEPQIVHWYQQWGSGESRFRGDWMAEVADSGRIPMISWEAWAKPEGSFSSADQDLGRMSAIADGEHDAYIDEWAAAAAAYGEPILLRPFHEMNGFWYPWSVGVNGNTNEDYIAGWRHVVDRFDAAGADNVSFIWSINTLASFEEGKGVEAAYPGDDYVDWVATSGFNWDNYEPEWSSWVTAEWVFGDTYELLASFDKPVMFAEIGTGTDGGDGAQWVTEAMAWFETLPELNAIVWFDHSYDGNVDFHLEPDQQAAFAKAVATSQGRFQPDLVIDGPETP